MIPNFLLVGAPKCGTTSLYFYLDQHPQIYMSPMKEPHFLSDEMRISKFSDSFRAMAEARLTGLEEYLAGDMSSKFSAGPIERWEDYLLLFRNRKHEIAAGEASTCYLWSPSAPVNIATRFPDAKIFMVLRDPAERAFSQYLHMLTFADAPLSFREYLDRALSSKSTIVGELYPFLHFGFYAEQLRRYRELFPPEQIRVYWYDDYQRDPGCLLQDVFRFLGVDPGFRPDLTQRYRLPQVPRSYALNRLLRPVWQTVKTAVPAQLGEGLKRRVFRPRASMTMQADDRDFLRRFYQYDVQLLQELTGRDLSAWQPE